MTDSSSIPSLQLPAFTPLEPLTRGTNLPDVSLEELNQPEPQLHKTAPTPESIEAEGQKPVDSKSNPGRSTPSPTPGTKPTSVRRFFSRVSIASNHSQDDKGTLYSETLQPDGTKKKRRSWWSRKVKRHSMMPAVGGSKVTIPGLEETDTNGKTQNVQSTPPPPRLPDDMFGKDLAAMDGDMFTSLQMGSGDTSNRQ